MVQNERGREKAERGRMKRDRERGGGREEINLERGERDEKRGEGETKRKRRGREGERESTYFITSINCLSFPLLSLHFL